jgi:hypothetical protein
MNEKLTGGNSSPPAGRANAERLRLVCDLLRAVSGSHFSFRLGRKTFFSFDDLSAGYANQWTVTAVVILSDHLNF